MLSDAKGRFVFTDLPPKSTYFITTSKPGYANGYYGAGGVGRLGDSISITEGQWFNTANVAMLRLGSISGLLTDEHGEPMPGVFVRVLSQVMAGGAPHLGAGLMAKTDDRGVYRIGGLKPGIYLVNVPSVQSAVPASAVNVLSVQPGTPGIDSLGFIRVNDAPGFLSVDDRNRLELGNYPTAPVSTERPLVYPSVFFPHASTAATAGGIELGAGEERAGVDMRMDLVPGFRITGRLDGPPDVIAGQVVRLMASGSEDLGRGGETATALVSANGAFTLLNVPAGTYTVDVQRTITEFDARLYAAQFVLASGELPSPPGLVMEGMSFGGSPSISSLRSRGADTHIGRLAIAVDTHDISGVVVSMQRTVKMTGSVVWEGPPPADWGVTTIQAEPARGTPALGVHQNPAVFDVTETFAIAGLQPGEYVLRASNPRAAGIVKSVRWSDRDYTDAPFDTSSGGDLTNVVVTLTTEAPVLEGVVRTGRVLARGEAVALAFPAERDQWSGYGLTPTRIQTATIGSDGAYRFDKLPAGNYCVIAIDPRQKDNWQDPKWLEMAAQLASRVVLRWGARTVQNLTVAAIK